MQHKSSSGKSTGSRLVSAEHEMKNIINTGNKGMPNHICFCAVTIQLNVSEPTRISTVVIIRPIELSQSTIHAAEATVQPQVSRKMTSAEQQEKT